MGTNDGGDQPTQPVQPNTDGESTEE